MLSSWWRKLLSREPPLIGNASLGRTRTYSADSGYVYQYSFLGFRRRGTPGDSTAEYVFELSSGRSPGFRLAILLTDSALRSYVAGGRELSASERYGIAKVALKRALDGFDHPGSIPPAVVPDSAELQAIGEMLDL